MIALLAGFLLAATVSAIPPASAVTYTFTRGAFLARGMAARPVGMAEFQPPITAPRFDVFVVLPLGSRVHGQK